jgi:hypothetical protein
LVPFPNSGSPAETHDLLQILTARWQAEMHRQEPATMTTMTGKLKLLCYFFTFRKNYLSLCNIACKVQSMSNRNFLKLSTTVSKNPIVAMKKLNFLK